MRLSLYKNPRPSCKNERLLVFFGGFACGEFFVEFLKPFLPRNADLLAVFADGLGFCEGDIIKIAGQYAAYDVLGWSFGVGVLSRMGKVMKGAERRIAISGSTRPIDLKFGIPPAIFQKTVSSFCDEVRETFYERICGKGDLSMLRKYLSSEGGTALRGQLEDFFDFFKASDPVSATWCAAIVCGRDKIFPLRNLLNEWGNCAFELPACRHFDTSAFSLAFSFLNRCPEKTRISFERSVDTYESSATVQREAAVRLAELVAQKVPSNCSRILEIGCGTGFLSRQLQEAFRESEWIFNDLSAGMCLRATKSRGDGKSKPLVGDATRIPLPTSCDAILSASCFQWIDDMPCFLKRLVPSLKGGGILAFSTFGEDNFLQIRDICGKGLKYENVDKLSKYLYSSGFGDCEFVSWKRDLEFDSPIDILRHMKLTGVNGKFSEFWTPPRIRRFSEMYAKKYSRAGKFILTYNPICVISSKI